MDVDRAGLNALAASQCGLLTRSQLLARGVTARAIEWRLSTRRWRSVHPGVYLTSPGRSDWSMHAMAAVLASGPGAVLSHRSAGHTYGLMASPPAEVEVLVPHRRTVTPVEGIVVRRCHRLSERIDDGDHWVPRTRVDHTVLDIADLLTDPDEVIALVAAACQHGLTWDAGLLASLAARGRHRWRGLLEPTLVDVGAGAESVLEVRFVRDVERPHGLPVSVAQVATGGGRRRHDRGYDDQRVLVELQGLAFHGSARQQVRDGRRVRDGLREGWTTVPGYWSDVASSPCAFAVELGAILRRHGWSGQPRRCRRGDCAVPRASSTS